jgi:microcompartment protein CcmK/EutM
LNILSGGNEGIIVEESRWGHQDSRHRSVVLDKVGAGAGSVVVSGSLDIGVGAGGE